MGARYSFTPVAIETFGAMGKRLFTFVKELGHRIRQCTGEVKARDYVLQHLSVAAQRGNAASVLGSGVGICGRPVRAKAALHVKLPIHSFFFLYLCLFAFSSPRTVYGRKKNPQRSELDDHVVDDTRVLNYDLHVHCHLSEYRQEHEIVQCCSECCMPDHKNPNQPTF